ncbi:MAG: PepSY domain-containing protein [Phycisphaerales bacterium]|nr:PepSY domain-containing protein [Phycisphaerales bacterium]
MEGRIVRAQLLWRKVHYWVSIAIALPLLLIIATGVLLQVKKDFAWIQPPERRGDGAPGISFEAVLAATAAVPEADVRGWTDIQRIDVRPDKSLLKVTATNGWEVQLDVSDGRVLQSAPRRSDLIEALHDGSWFGSAVKRWVFLPSAVLLLLLWATGIYLFLLPQLRRRAPAAR